MKFEKVSIVNFRNFENIEIDVSNKNVFFQNPFFHALSPSISFPIEKQWQPIGTTAFVAFPLYYVFSISSCREYEQFQIC